MLRLPPYPRSHQSPSSPHLTLHTPNTHSVVAVALSVKDDKGWCFSSHTVSTASYMVLYCLGGTAICTAPANASAWMAAEV